MRILVIDVGGTHVKVLATGHKRRVEFESGPKMTPSKMVAAVRAATAGWKYDAVSMGYPGPVVHVRFDQSNPGVRWCRLHGLQLSRDKSGCDYWPLVPALDLLCPSDDPKRGPTLTLKGQVWGWSLPPAAVNPSGTTMRPNMSHPVRAGMWPAKKMVCSQTHTGETNRRDLSSKILPNWPRSWERAGQTRSAFESGTRFTDKGHSIEARVSAPPFFCFWHELRSSCG